jgi:hypothetical protein
MILRLVITFMFVLITSGCGSGSSESIPQPTKTVYVPVPQSGVQSNIQENFESDLQGIKEANCRLAQDLLMQSLDLDDQARDLERQASALGSSSDLYFKMRDQARNLEEQATNLLIKSSQLRQNC